MLAADYIIHHDEPVLITGANGFIGTRVVEALCKKGFNNLKCFVRPSSNTSALKNIIRKADNTQFSIIEGNLLSRDDCSIAVRGAGVIFHLAAGIEKSFPGSFLNSVITTRNLLEAVLTEKTLKRFLNVSSFAVYSNAHIKRGGLLDEQCDVEARPYRRYEAYTFAKARQDDIVMEYNKKHGIPYVIVRPGAVYGPGKSQLTARVGIDTFGFFMHLGGSNTLPLTYVTNCAEAMVLAGITRGVDGEIFNIVDDDLPTSRAFLKMYKQHAGRFTSIYVPYPVFYCFCYMWEKYAAWSRGQLPPVFNRSRCETYWKGNRYSNRKLKTLLGWKPSIPFKAACREYFESIQKNGVCR